MTTNMADNALERSPAIACLTNEFEAMELTAESTFIEITPATDLCTISAVAPFDQKDTHEIIRQVEYYFSDQNLPNDAHLLGLAGGDGNELVSLNEISGWRKMRAYKPRKALKDVIAQSTVLEVVEINKKVRIKRRYPLQLKINVRPEVDIEKTHFEETLMQNPQLTKAILKPTGFEEYYTDAPITPAQYKREQRLYDPYYSFEERIETAIRHYSLRRKFHQSTAKVFSLWMNFGGINTSPNAFQGGMTEEDFEDYDKDEVAAMKSNYAVDEYITNCENTSIVDFKGVALAFLSTEFPTYFTFDDPDEIDNVCNVMDNFFNYLLHHDVCPEYKEQIIDARVAVRAAAPELRRLPKVNAALCTARPFGDACTQLHEDQHFRDDSPWAESYRERLSDDDAMMIFKAGLVAYATEEQLDTIEKKFAGFECSDSVTDIHHNKSKSPFEVVIGDTIGLEVISMQHAEGDMATYFDGLSGTVVPRLGVMHCRRWDIPGAPPEDLPADRPQVPESFDIIMEQHILDACYIGVKLQAQVKVLDIGFCWLQLYMHAFPSFFTSIVEIKQVKQRERQNMMLEAWLASRPGPRSSTLQSTTVPQVANAEPNPLTMPTIVAEAEVEAIAVS